MGIQLEREYGVFISVNKGTFLVTEECLNAKHRQGYNYIHLVLHFS